MSLTEMIRERRRRFAARRAAAPKRKAVRPQPKSKAKAKRPRNKLAAAPVGHEGGGEPAQDGGPADVAEVAALCAEAGRSELAEVLIRQKASAEEVLVRLHKAEEIVTAVTMARKICPAIDTAEADTFIAANATPHHAKVVLFEKILAAQSPEISNILPSDSRSAKEDRNHGWDDVVDDYNAQIRSEPEPAR